MARLKGIVAEVSGSKCLLITQDGQFLRVNKPSKAVVGEEIEVQQSNNWLRLVPAMVAVLVLSFMIPSFNMLTASAKPAAYLSLDINPSIDLGVDKNGTVVEVKGLNPEGEKLAASVSLNKQKIYEAVHLLVEEAIKEGYVNHSKANLIMAAYTNDAGYTFNEQQIKGDLVGQLKDADLEAEIVVLGTEMAVHKQASSSNISQGKYEVYEAAQAKGAKLSLQELKEDGIKNALTSKGVQVDELVPGVEKIELGEGLNKKESPSDNSKGEVQKDQEKGKGSEKQPKEKEKSQYSPKSKVNQEPQSSKRPVYNYQSWNWDDNDKKAMSNGKADKDD